MVGHLHHVLHMLRQERLRSRATLRVQEKGAEVRVTRLWQRSRWRGGRGREGGGDDDEEEVMSFDLYDSGWERDINHIFRLTPSFTFLHRLKNKIKDWEVHTPHFFRHGTLEEILSYQTIIKKGKKKPEIFLIWQPTHTHRIGNIFRKFAYT